MTERSNLPGQTEIRYRTGDWSSFRARMIACLSTEEMPNGSRPLQALTARDDADGSIALIDAAACTLDVLTFYGERQLNERYLSTATERLSLTLIARELGYEPSPGLAASGYLAFTTSALTTGPVTVPIATPVMAMPEGTTPPPKLETIEEIEARPEWSAIPISKRRAAPLLQTGTTEIWVDGIETRAKPGDGVLIYGTDRLASEGSERWDFRRLIKIADDTDHAETRLIFDRALGDSVTAPPEIATEVLIFRNRASLFGYNAPDWGSQSNQVQLTAWGRANRSFSGLPGLIDPYDDRTRLMRRSPPVTEWPNFALADDPAVATNHIDLDREHPGIVAGSWVVLADAYHVEAYEVLRVSQRSRVDFGLTAKVTRLQLRGEHLDWFDRRATVVYCEPDSFRHVGAPDLSAATDANVSVRGDRTDLLDRLVSFYGPSPDDATLSGEVVAVTMATYEAATDVTHWIVDPPLLRAYSRGDLKINANLALATHGETAADEVLGSGNAAEPFQSFVLKGRPLTHLATAEGASASLIVRVSGVQWEEVPYLWGSAPDAKVYRLIHVSDGTTIIEFGDGVNGARLPTGVENVVVSYRTGIGLVGEVAPGRASLLTRRPSGVDGAINPAAFSGAADPESADMIRENAPRSVLTLDRLVSLQDYEDFTRSYPGIGKAMAASLSEGQRRLVHLTIASESGQPILQTDPLWAALVGAIEANKDPIHQLTTATFTPRAFGVDASILIDSTYLWDDVTARVRERLADAFSFVARRFGQGVTPAEVIAVMHGVAGVVAVDLDSIWRVDAPNIVAPPQVILQAAPPMDVNGQRQTGELLLISEDETDVILEPMVP